MSYVKLDLFQTYLIEDTHNTLHIFELLTPIKEISGSCNQVSFTIPALILGQLPNETSKIKRENA